MQKIKLVLIILALSLPSIDNLRAQQTTMAQKTATLAGILASGAILRYWAPRSTLMSKLLLNALKKDVSPVVR